MPSGNVSDIPGGTHTFLSKIYKRTDSGRKSSWKEVILWPEYHVVYVYKHHKVLSKLLGLSMGVSFDDLIT